MANQNQVRILDQWGHPFAPSRQRGVVGPPRMRALNGSPNIPYDAADIYGGQMADWRPYLWSPDGEMSFGQRDRIVARARDAERNDGWAKGGVTKILDTVIGANFRPISKPDYRALAYFTGIKGFDAVWADEFGHAIDACWRTWAGDINHYCDGMQCLTMAQLCWVAMRHNLLDGDALGGLLYRPELLGPGKARYATALQLIDPDRLSNPQLTFDKNVMRGGVEVDNFGVPEGYWIRRAHAGDWFNAAKSVHWDYFPRRTPWGRPIIVHSFDHDRAGQHHGGAGVLTSVLQRMRMLMRYDSAEMEAAIINAIFAAYVKSPYDPQMVAEAMDSDHAEETALGAYQEQRNEFWDERKRMWLGGSQVTHLFPGEEIGQVRAERPASNYEPFEVQVLRHIASGMGITYEQISGDFSRTNFSSFRGATNEVKKTFDRRAKNFDSGFFMPVRGAAVEEFMDVEDVPLPAGAPPFEEFRLAYSSCRLLRPGRGWTNPLDEIRASGLAMQYGLSTLEEQAADAMGEDWEEIVDQRAIEIQRFKDRGLELPEVYQGPPTPPEAAPGGRPGSKPDGGKIGSGG
ncbi:MAG TPA: phage portal protein [Acetobacteraceae bacterium]|jgi:lambda family phage portal protein|nr:phage portal protein [Acetobacteraceae bacterium]